MPFRVRSLFALIVAASALAGKPCSARADITDSREYALLKKDSQIGMGLWVQDLLLDTYRLRLNLRSELKDPMVAYAAKPSDTAFETVFSAGASAFAAPTLFVVASGSEDSGAKNAFRCGLRVGTGVLGVVISTTSLPQVLSDRPGETVDHPAQVGHYFFRRNEQKDGQKKRAEAENEKLRAQFLGQIRSVSEGISHHFATVLGLPETQKFLLQQKVEGRMVARFKAKAVWDANTRVFVDLPSLMKEIDSEAALRLAIFDREVAAAKAARVPIQVESQADIRKGFEDLIWTTERTHEESLKIFNSFQREKDDPKVVRLAKQYWDYTIALETYLARLRAHVALLPPADE